jgi:NadR type nicotinamide-nucleotide adenylyltransferase
VPTGVTVGKFFPFHLGHDHLIRTAKSRVERLFVVVAAKPEHPVGNGVRASWIREAHPDVEVLETPDDIPEAPEPWGRRCLELLPERPDIAFTSEDYGPAWAAAMGARHEDVDNARSRFPISGTELRADLGRHWEMLTPPAKAHFCRRVRVLGVESSGTTTLAEDLAGALETPWVREYGREYWEERRLKEGEWATADFVRIAKEQARREDALAREANRVLVCDTDPLATGVWQRRYMGGCEACVAAVARGRRYDLSLLTVPDFPFVQDGTRDGEAVRKKMHEWFVEALDRDFLAMEGSRERRLEIALRACEALREFAPIG